MSPESFRWVGLGKEPVLAGPLIPLWLCSDPARSSGSAGFAEVAPWSPSGDCWKEASSRDQLCAGSGVQYVCSRPFGGCILHLSGGISRLLPMGAGWHSHPLSHPSTRGGGRVLAGPRFSDESGTAWHGGVCALVAIRCPACCCGLGAPGLGLAETC